MTASADVALELLAALLAVAYLLLAIRESRWCWPVALVSSLLYAVVMGQARLYMDAGLQVFYAALAIYGYWQWRPASSGRAALVIHRWPWSWHGAALAAVALASAASAWMLSAYTDAARPLVDSVTTWGAVLATVLVARKVFENWYYWFVVDSLSLALFVDRGLYLTAGLFAVYLVLIIVGIRAWQRLMDAPSAVGS